MSSNQSPYPLSATPAGITRLRLRLGKMAYELPSDAVVHVVRRGRVAYVCHPRGDVLALTSTGEIVLPRELRGLVRSRVFGVSS